MVLNSIKRHLKNFIKRSRSRILHKWLIIHIEKSNLNHPNSRNTLLTALKLLINPKRIESRDQQNYTAIIINKICFFVFYLNGLFIFHMFKICCNKSGMASGTKSALHLFSLKSENLKLQRWKNEYFKPRLEFDQVYTPTNLEAGVFCRHWNFVGLYKMSSIRVGTLQIVFNSDKDSWRLLNPKP